MQIKVSTKFIIIIIIIIIIIFIIIIIIVIIIIIIIIINIIINIIYRCKKNVAITQKKLQIKIDKNSTAELGLCLKIHDVSRQQVLPTFVKVQFQMFGCSPETPM